MIRNFQYIIITRWLVIFAIVLFPVVSEAQSNQAPDSVAQEETTTDEDSSYFENPPAPDSLTFRAAPDSAIKRMQNEEAFAYANDPEYWKKKRLDSSNTSINLSPLSGLISYMFIVIFVAVLVYLVYKILSENNIILFKRNKKVFGQSNDAVSQEQPANLSSLIREAEEKGAFRLATRYRYMWLLQELDARQLIRMHAELTNWDYIKQLGTHPLNQKFRYLTTAYEYAWYGEFELNNAQYDLIRKRFESFLH